MIDYEQFPPNHWIVVYYDVPCHGQNEGMITTGSMEILDNIHVMYTCDECILAMYKVDIL